MVRVAQRIFGERCKIVVLPLVLERDPIVPHIVERPAEHMFELARVEGLRILGAAKPFDGLVDPVGQREIGEEAGSVEVGIGADLEVDLGAFAFEPKRREEALWSRTLARNTISS